MAKLSSSARIIEALKKYDIFTFKDVIFHLPRSYLNLSYSNEFAVNTNDKVMLYLEATSAPVIIKTPKVLIIRFTAISDTKTPYLIVAYNQRYIMRLITPGTKFSVYGTINLHKREISVSKIFPRLLNPNEQLVPLYTLPSEIANHEYKKIVEKALKETTFNSLIPQSFRSKNDLISLNNAFSYVHLPMSLNDVFRGLKTLKYEEGLRFFLKLLMIKRQNSTLHNDQKNVINLKAANAFVKSLPFTLTKDQIIAIREIGHDMNEQTLMYRLLQGDVGSGKTIVAFSALYINYLRKAQGALLAPTESLAKQHYDSLLKFFAPFKIRIGLLIGALSETEKNILKRNIAEGKIDIIVGTHALFSDDVFYHSLELVVIDEQHKFGVNQRQLLLSKGEKADLLLLSATPIPQTLANVVYGDMDITTLKQFPHSGRQVITEIKDYSLKELATFIDNALLDKRQVYIIAPKISAGDHTNVLYLYRLYKERYGEMVGLLHGQMSSEEKEQSLDLFKAGITPILVATTVVEVGIDVKNAGLMIIYEPNSFGLSSLHQLRGRIGRDGKKAHLCLVTNEEDRTKLEAFAIENDGFKIAQLDLSLRGPGELTGEKQSGMPSFLYLNVIKDCDLIKTIKEDALTILNDPLNDEYKEIMESVSEALKSSTM